MLEHKIAVIIGAFVHRDGQLNVKLEQSQSEKKRKKNNLGQNLHIRAVDLIKIKRFCGDTCYIKQANSGKRLFTNRDPLTLAVGENSK